MAVCKSGMPSLLVLHSVHTRCIFSFFHEWCDRHRVYSFANERVGEAIMPAERVRVRGFIVVVGLLVRNASL